jgi:hypothetical protein
MTDDQKDAVYRMQITVEAWRLAVRDFICDPENPQLEAAYKLTTEQYDAARTAFEKTWRAHE